jgi:hypothetical protein
VARLGPVSGGPLAFRLEGVPYTLLIPADGLEVCGWAADGNWYALVPGALAPESLSAFEGLLADPYGPVGLRACVRLVYHLSRAVYGHEWHVAQRLAVTAQEHWDIYSAWTVTVGFDPGAAPAHRVCASVLAWLRGGCQDEKDHMKLEAQLYAPPRVTPRKGRTLMPGFSKQDQADAWQKAFAELGGG